MNPVTQVLSFYLAVAILTWVALYLKYPDKPGQALRIAVLWLPAILVTIKMKVRGK